MGYFLVEKRKMTEMKIDYWTESLIFFFDNHFCGVDTALRAVQLYRAHVLNLLRLFCKLTLKIK